VSDVSAGWYKDPTEPTTQRYWDGEGWIGDPLPLDATPPPGPPGPRRPSAGPAPGPVPDTAGTPATQPAHPTQRAQTARPGTRTGPARPHGYEVAEPALRLAARAIDIVAVFGLNIVVNGWFLYRLWRQLRPYAAELQRIELAGGSVNDAPQPDIGWLVLVILFIAIALWFAYEVPAMANSGQTLGKRLVGIRVLRLESDGALGLRRAIRRWNTLGLTAFLCGSLLTCWIGLILQVVDSVFILIDRPLHQALHDRSARTVVVTVPKEKSLP